MQIKSFASIILLGLAAISYGRAVDTQEDLVLRSTDSLTARDSFLNAPPKPVVCKKRASPRVFPKAQPKAVVSEPNTYIKTPQRPKIQARTPEKFIMSGGPKMGLLNEPTPLWTDQLGGCSVVVIASSTHVFATHCPRGRGTFDPVTGTMGSDYVTPEVVAQAEAEQLIMLWKTKKAEAGSVKAMVITADQTPYSDEVAITMRNELAKGGIAKIDWYTYDAMAIFAMPAGEAKLAAGRLTINAAGAGKLPAVILGGTCYNFT